MKKTKTYMELIEIIRTSLFIFVLASASFLLISYLVYKYRERNRVKPYLKDKNFNSPVLQIKGNETLEIIEEKPIKRNPRFRILNESLAENRPPAINISPVHSLRQKPVISYYSFNRNETLHKFTNSRLADEEV